MKRRGLLGFAACAIAFVLVWVGVTFAYGGYDDHYDLVGDFPRAGQGLAGGSDVSYRGCLLYTSPSPRD